VKEVVAELHAGLSGRKPWHQQDPTESQTVVVVVVQAKVEE
jgi:hypothetical protein